MKTSMDKSIANSQTSDVSTYTTQRHTHTSYCTTDTTPHIHIVPWFAPPNALLPKTHPLLFPISNSPPSLHHRPPPRTDGHLHLLLRWLLHLLLLLLLHCIVLITSRPHIHPSIRRNFSRLRITSQTAIQTRTFQSLFINHITHTPFKSETILEKNGIRIV